MSSRTKVGVGLIVALIILIIVWILTRKAAQPEVSETLIMTSLIPGEQIEVNPLRIGEQCLMPSGTLGIVTIYGACEAP
jgi:hypothetical protein